MIFPIDKGRQRGYNNSVNGAKWCEVERKRIETEQNERSLLPKGDITKLERGDAAAMKWFLGEYRQVMDAKNRIFIPAKLREQLGDVVYVTRNVDFCLSVYSEEGWEAYCAKLSALPSSEGSELLRFVFSSALDARLDSQGRIILTPVLRDYAELKKDIYVIGVGDHVEIWDKDKRDADKTEAKEADLISFMRKHNF